MNVRVKMEGLDELVRLLGAERARKAVREAVRAGTIAVHKRLPPYPPQAHRPMEWKSDRQRRWFFWALRTGRIKVPYRRTGTLGRFFATRVLETGSKRIVGEIGTHIRYAPWVVSEETWRGIGPQARIHRGVWWTLQDVARRNLDAFKRAAKAVLKRWLEEK